jgi:hypothetical protein
MRKFAIACLASMLVIGCTKEKIVTTPCGFDLSVDSVKGSKVQVTITPENQNACYICVFTSEGQPQYSMTDNEQVDFQLGWMEEIYQGKKNSGAIASFADLFCFKGTRTIRETQCLDDTGYRLIVFQINPETHKAIGPVYKADFRTLPIPKSDLGFKVQYGGDKLCIVPSNNTDTWFWEYEKASKLTGIYGSPFLFYYSVIDMYDQYGFLENQLCKGPDEWVFSRDDRSIKEDVAYTLCVSGCADGEITTEVYYVDFTIRNGQIEFGPCFYQEVVFQPLQ